MLISTLYELEALPIGTVIGFNWPPRHLGLGRTYQLLSLANVQKEGAESHWWKLLLEGHIGPNGSGELAQFRFWVDSRNNQIGEPDGPAISVHWALGPKEAG